MIFKLVLLTKFKKIHEMKKIVYFSIILLGLSASAQVGIGIPSANIHTSAQLEVASTTKGFLAPRMTEAQKNNIDNPAAGLLVYQTDGTNGFYYFDGSVWKSGLGPQGVAGSNASITLGEIASSSNSNGASITDGILNLAPADINNGGIVTINAQTFEGNKSFTSNGSFNGQSIGKGNATGGENLAVGAGAMNAVSTGVRNTAIGNSAMQNYAGTSFDNNTSVGYANLIGLTTGSGNTSVGAESMMALTIGTSNTSIGNQSLINTTGDNNVGVGKNTGSANSTGNNNTIIGTEANLGAGNLNNASAIGYEAIAEASNTIQLGNSEITDVKTSGAITASGFKTLSGTSSQYLMADGSVTNSTISVGAIDTSSNSNGVSVSNGILTLAPADLYNGGVVTIDNQTFGGEKTFEKDITVNGITVGSGPSSMMMGQPFSNTLLGNGVTVGEYASESTAIGFEASATGPQSIAIGAGASANQTQGISLGYHASLGTGYGFAIGSYAQSNGMYSVGLGPFSITNGNYSTAIGYQALAEAENSIAIGKNAEATVSNSIQLGNNDITNVKTSGKLTAGTVVYTNTHNSTEGQVLTTDASGGTYWTTPSVASTITEVADEFTATASQTSFTLTNTPSINSKVKMYVNGIRISNTAYSISGTTLTYISSNNGSYALSANDRIQFDYSF